MRERLTQSMRESEATQHRLANAAG
ncbi:hypothetical protein KIPB_016946, partial [Kipferlia bialata]